MRGQRHFIKWIAFLNRAGGKIRVLLHKNPTIVKFELNDLVATSKGGVRITPTTPQRGDNLRVDDH